MADPDDLRALLHRAAAIDERIAGRAGVIPTCMRDPDGFQAAAVAGMVAMAEALGQDLTRFGYQPGDLP